MIKRNDKIPGWMKNAFSWRENRIFVKSQAQLPPGVTQKDVPEWFTSAARAIQSGDWHLTTAASNVSKDSLYPNDKLQGDFEPGDAPVWGHKEDGVMVGETIDSYPSNEYWGKRKMRDERASGDTDPALRRPATDKKPAQGLIVVANRFRSPIDSSKEVSRSEDSILETFFHELSAHAGLRSQGISDEHGPLGNWLSIQTEPADHLAKAVHEFFSAPSETEAIKSVTPTTWEQAARSVEPKETVWQRAANTTAGGSSRKERNRQERQERQIYGE
ncbi:hypothetical protein WMF45_35570 [Sorangium sp. So ce448]|uniref:hypothetical protein n=1 Tax=Sorangium sp. So ce448 TaxID=3133314 RepID=UPI003F5E7672